MLVYVCMNAYLCMYMYVSTFMCICDYILVLCTCTHNYLLRYTSFIKTHF